MLCVADWSRCHVYRHRPDGIASQMFLGSPITARSLYTQTAGGRRAASAICPSFQALRG